jgi:uncharacterized protein (TIGR03000 family)
MVVPAAPAAPAAPAEKKATSVPTQATIVVSISQDAKLFVDGEPVTMTAASRSFLTPQLAPGNDYYYTFKAEAVRDGQTVTETKRVTFRAGDVAQVNFTTLGTAPARELAAQR